MVMKLFLPAGSEIYTEDTVKLSNGQIMPKWAFVAVPIDAVPQAIRRKKTGTPKQVFVDAVSGALATARKAPTSEGNRGESYSGQYDFTNYSRTIDAAKFLTAVENALPVLVDDSVRGETDPGFFEAVPAAPRTVTPVGVSNTDFSSPEDYELGTKTLADYLVRNKIPQRLDSQRGKTQTQIVYSLLHIAVNVVDPVNDTNPYMEVLRVAGRRGFSDRPLPFKIHSGFVGTDGFAPNAAFYLGEAVRLEFEGSSEQVYQKAVDMALKLPFDELYLDYRSVTGPLITVVATDGSQRKRLFTRYDDTVVCTGKLLNLVRNVDLTDLQETPPANAETEIDLHFDELDDYSGLERMLRDRPELFGGTVSAMNILTQLGAGANPFLSNLAGKSPLAGTVANVAKTVREAMSSVLQCPEQVTKDPRLFPTSSSQALKTLTDLTQMDDSDTQDNQPFPIRANNPLRVKVVAGVTDLVTRFGYLGEAGGIAVYRDHIGGAAAGLNYIMSTAAGATMGTATKSILGNLMGSQNAGAASAGDDLTAITPSKIFQNMGQHLFGVSDPSGILQECATVSGDDFDSLVSYAGALAKTVSNLQTSPLTHDEWASAYQIAKNEPNGHVTRSTTGVDLPVTEQSNTQPTGVRTDRQGKETKATTDNEMRSDRWNPVTDFDTYEDSWGIGGANWIAGGLVSYERKSGADDTSSKIAKAQETETMNQEPKHPTNITSLDWDKQ